MYAASDIKNAESALTSPLRGLLAYARNLADSYSKARQVEALIENNPDIDRDAILRIMNSN